MNRYIINRKKLVNEERKLIRERNKINKQLLKLRQEMQCWDNWLVLNE